MSATCRFVCKGKVVQRPGITVELWGPEQAEPELLREHFYRRHGATIDKTDAELQQIIDGAKEWIGGLRLSWTVVSANYLKGGRYVP